MNPELLRMIVRAILAARMAGEEEDNPMGPRGRRTWDYQAAPGGGQQAHFFSTGHNIPIPPRYGAEDSAAAYLWDIGAIPRTGVRPTEERLSPAQMQRARANSWQGRPGESRAAARARGAGKTKAERARGK